MRYGIYV